MADRLPLRNSPMNRLAKELVSKEMGPDPEMVQACITMMAYYVERGTRKFAAVAKRIVEDLGDKVVPMLASTYLAVRRAQTMKQFRPEMDGADYVDGLTDEQILAMLATPAADDAADDADDAQDDAQPDAPDERSADSIARLPRRNSPMNRLAAELLEKEVGESIDHKVLPVVLLLQWALDEDQLVEQEVGLMGEAIQAVLEMWGDPPEQVMEDLGLHPWWEEKSQAEMMRDQGATAANLAAELLAAHAAIRRTLPSDR